MGVAAHSPMQLTRDRLQRHPVAKDSSVSGPSAANRRLQTGTPSYRSGSGVWSASSAGGAQHPAKWVIAMLDAENRELATEQIRRQCLECPRPEHRAYLDWVPALFCESVPDAASQLQTVRRDYLLDNLRSIMRETTTDHLYRS